MIDGPLMDEINQAAAEGKTSLHDAKTQRDDTLSPQNLMKSLNKISRTLTSKNIVSYTHLSAAIAELASRRDDPAAQISSDIEFALNNLAYFCGENGGAALDFISEIRAHIAALEAKVAELTKSPPYKSVRNDLLGRYATKLKAENKRLLDHANWRNPQYEDIQQALFNLFDRPDIPQDAGTELRNAVLAYVSKLVGSEP